ncbi:hypothetical protein FDP41_003683 [Naegleria fowleri]|uniref:Uncharacterized protein n=2 Tax=Naegleria fowleri TaxID=5763 RepID=A0A6A5BTE7_NAEFO|nr:uncharacterized protein FDP41_003683 [Naegleria fowleri]KAF0977030.1 hypothetical protein FDP41_003683 [Naegleria fowleri]
MFQHSYSTDDPSIPIQQEQQHTNDHHDDDYEREMIIHNDSMNIVLLSQQIYEYIAQKDFMQALKLLIEWMNSDQATPHDAAHIIEFLKKIYKLGFHHLSHVFRELQENQNDCKKLILAAMYCGRCGHPVDYEKAISLFESSDSLKSHYFSQNMMGNIYSNGNGVDIDYTKAKEYYEMAAKQNYSSGFHNLGNMYYYGNGVQQDFTKAMELFELAAQKTHYDVTCNKYLAFENHYAEALYVLGTMYELGDGVEKDTRKAIEYYQQAVQLNHEYAAFSIGETFEIDNNYEEAVKYFKIASSLNFVEAQYRLAEMYRDGIGAEQNLTKAIYYFELAAENEYYDAEDQSKELRLQRFCSHFHNKLLSHLALHSFSDVCTISFQEVADED